MTLEQGDLLYNRYRILDILGRGGMGSVYHAIDESLGVEVAVKENMFVTEEYEQQFRLEAVILASLRHPNLPRVTDHFTIEDQGQYLVMDYIEGRDLRHMMDDGPLPEEEAVRIGVAVCDALTYLHKRRPSILHRDIKPGNVRIAPDGHVYLVDFGLAKMGNEDENTLTGARAMTPGYSPPEQYGTSRTDTRTDVYSLGATLYAALTGFIPEDGLARVVDEVKLTPITKRNPKISKRTEAVIEKAMEPQAARRYQSAEKFKRALLNLEPEQDEPESEPAAAEALTVPPEPSEPAEKKIRGRSRKASLFIWVIRLGILAAIASGIGWAVMYPARASETLRNVLALVITPTSPATATTAPALTFTPSSVPNQTATSKPPRTATPPAASTTVVQPVVTLTSSPTLTETPLPDPEPTLTGGGTGAIAFASMQDGIPQIYLANADGSNLQPLTHELNGACQPSWSPDGKKLVYVSPCANKNDQYPQSSLYVLEIETGSVTPLPSVRGGDFEPAWAPDGEKIAFTSLRDLSMQIYVIDLTDLSVLTLTKPGNNAQSRQPAWSPDGEQIAYTVGRSGLLQIWKMLSNGSDAAIQLIRSGSNVWDSQPAWSPDGTYILYSKSRGVSSAPAALARYNLDESIAPAIDLLLPVLDVTFSPDGNWIAYETLLSNNQDIYIYNLSGGAPQRLTTSPALDFDPAWRP